MSRTLDLTLPVADLADRQALGTRLAQVVAIAAGYAKAPTNNYAVTFAAAGGQERIAFTSSAWEQARGRGLAGAALLNALTQAR